MTLLFDGLVCGAAVRYSKTLVHNCEFSILHLCLTPALTDGQTEHYCTANTCLHTVCYNDVYSWA